MIFEEIFTYLDVTAKSFFISISNEYRLNLENNVDNFNAIEEDLPRVF